MEYLQAFTDHLEAKGASKITIKNYLADVRKFIRFIEETYARPFQLSDFTADSIKAYKASLQSIQTSINSQERYLSSLRKFGTFLHEEHKLPFNPFTASMDTKPNTDIWALSPFKQDLLLNKASELTIKNYVLDIKQFVSWLENVDQNISKTTPFSSITTDVIEEYKTRLVEEMNLSPLSVNRKLSSIRRYATFLLKSERLTTQPLILNTESPLDQNISEDNNAQIHSFEKATPVQPEETQETVTQPLEHAEAVTPPYSAFAPVRLSQKLQKLFRIIFDTILILPIIEMIEKASLIVRKSQGAKGLFEDAVATGATQSGRSLLSTLTGIKKLTQTSGTSSALKEFIVSDPRKLFKGKISNLSKAFYAPLSISTENLPRHKKILHHLRYTRPNWYKKYHSYPIAHYLNFAIMMIFITVIGASMYSAFFDGGRKSPTLAAYTPNVAPPRILSFQGRLTDSSDNPITAAKNVRFAIYDDTSASGSGHLLWQELQSVTPDADGVFSVLMGNTGSSCGSPLTPATGACAIPSTLFTQNSTLFLGITIENDTELAPRQQVASVAYATNSETLQGLAPISGTNNTNVVLALDSAGNLTIGGSATPTFQASGGQFTLSGTVLNLTTTTGSNSNIQLNPDGSGKNDFQKAIINSTLNGPLPTAAGAVQVDDLFAVNATSSGQSAFTINQDSTGPLISASASGVAKFTVNNSGGGYFASSVGIGSTTPGATLDVVGSLRASGAITFSTFSNNGGLLYTNGSGAVAQTTVGGSGQCLQSIGGGTPTWGTCGANYWQLNSGALSPFSSTLDLLLGATATSSAKIGLININSGNPTATFSGNFSVSSPTGSAPTVTQNVLNGGSLNFQTSVGGDAGLTSRIFIKNDGNIGVGTTSPGTKLEVAGIARISNPGTTAIQIQRGDNTANYHTIRTDSGSGLIFDTAGASSNYQFQVNGVERIRLDINGNLGIGTTAPLALLDVNGAASASGSLTFRAGASTIQSTTNSSLTIGGNSTGNITLAPFNTTVGGAVLPAATNATDLGTSALQFRNINAQNYYQNGVALNVTNYWQRALGALAPYNITDDVLVGGSATGSALIKLGGTANASSFFNTGGTVGIGTTATTERLNIGAGNILLDNTYSLRSKDSGGTVRSIFTYTSANNLQLSNTASSGSVQISNVNGSGSIQFLTGASGLEAARFDATGNLGIGTTTPFGKLNVVGNATTPIGKSALVVIQNETNGDILTASAGATTRFVIKNDGNVGIGTNLPVMPLHVIVDGSGNGFRVGDASSTNYLNFVSGGAESRFETSANRPLKFRVNSIDALTIKGDGNVGIGTTTPNGALTVFGSTTVAQGQAILQVIQNNAADIFTASAGATTRFLIANDGTLTASKYTTNGGLLYTNGSGVFAQTGAGTATTVLHGGTTPSYSAVSLTADVSGILPIANGGTNGSATPTNGGVSYGTGTAYAFTAAGSSGFVLQSNGAAAPTWVDPAALSTSYWNLASGALFAKNATVDLLIGGSATTSAKFGLINVNSGTPTATISGNLAIAAPTGAAPATTYSVLNGGTINFRTSVGGDAGATSRFFISNNGNIGIGSTAPTQALDVVGNITANGTSGITLSGSGAGLTFSGASTHTISASSGTLQIGAATLTGTLNANSNTITNATSYNGLVITANTGVITTGTWNGTVIGTQYGGLGANVTAAGAGELLYSTATTTYGHLAAGTSGQALISGGAGAPSWANTNTSSFGLFDLANGAIYPKNATNDLLIGGNATTSAKFGFINVNSGNPTATISGNLAIATPTGSAPANTYSVLNGGTINFRTSVGGDAGATSKLYIANNGNVGVGTTNPLHTTEVIGSTLVGGNVGIEISGQTIRGGTSASGIAADHNIIINANSLGGTLNLQAASSSLVFLDASSGNLGIGGVTNPSSFKVQSGGSIGPNSNNAYDLGSTSLQWRNIYAAGSICFAGGTDCTSSFSTLGVNYWNQTAGTLQPKNTTLDLLIGGTATNSAKFGFINVNSGNPTATISGNLAIATPTGSAPANTYSILNGGSINFQTSVGGDTGLTSRLTILNNGNLGVGTTTPGGFFSVGSSSQFIIGSTGIVTAGTWNGTVIGTQYGGLGANVTAAGAGELLYSTATTTYGHLAAGTSGQALISGGAGAPSWANTNTSSFGLFDLANGAIYPKNATNDLLIGGNATTSAKFGFINVNSGTPTATVSSNFSLQVPTGSAPAVSENILNGGTWNLKTSVGGDAGLTSRLTLLNNGNLGVGTTSPAGFFSVGTSSQFIISNTGVVTAGTWNGTAIGAQYGGTGINTSASTGVPSISSGTWSVAATLATSLGGLGANVTAAGAGELLYSSGTTTYGHLAAGTSGQALISGGAGAPSWANTNSSSFGLWDLLTGGVLTPKNATTDLLLGGTSSASARIAFLNIAGGNPTASLSGNLAISSPTGSAPATGFLALNGGSLNFKTSVGGDAGATTRFSISNNGTLTASKFTLNGGLLYTDASGVFNQTTVGSNGQCLQSAGGGSPTWGSCGGLNYWTSTNGALYPTNATLDLLIGGTSSSAAKFTFTNVNSGTPTFKAYNSNSTQYVSINHDGTNANITASTGTINIGAGGGTLYLNTDINNDSTNFSGFVKVSDKLLVQADAGQNANALAIFDNTNATGGDILTASAAGVTKFVITGAGNVGIGTTLPSNLLTITSTSSFSQAIGLDTNSSAKQAGIGFSSAGTQKWQLGKNTDDSFYLYDSGLGRIDLGIASSGDMQLMANGGNVGIGTSSPVARLNLVTSGSNPTGKAAFILNQVETNGDLFTASASGTTKFKLTNGGSVVASDYYDITDLGRYMDPAGVLVSASFSAELKTDYGGITLGDPNIGAGTTITTYSGAGKGNFFTSVGSLITSAGGIGRGENFLRYSEQFDKSATTETAALPWVRSSTLSVGTNDNGACSSGLDCSPDGQQRAEKLTGGASTNNIFQTYNSTTTEVSGNPWTFSVWIKNGTATGTVNITIYDGFTTTTTPINMDDTSTNRWNRYFVTIPTPNASAKGIRATIDLNGNNTKVIYVWGAQLEKQGTVGMYIRTSDQRQTTTLRGLVAGTSGPSVIMSGNDGIATPSAATLLLAGNGGIYNGGSATNKNILELYNNVDNSAGSLTNNSSGIGFLFNRPGTNGTTNLATQVASISAVLTTASNSYAGALTFATANSGVPAERMRIDAAGNVGIGTSTAGQLLTVAGNARISSVNDTSISLAKTGGNGAGLIAVNGSQLGINFDSNGKFVLGQSSRANIDSNTYSGTDLVTVLSTGNVGINTGTPVNKLDVSGAAVIGTYAGTNTGPSNGLLVSGNVGIGTSTVSSRLHVIGAVNTSSTPASWTQNLIFDNLATSTQNITEFRVAGTKRASIRVDSSGNAVFQGSSTGGTYLAWDEGSGGVHFGSGAAAEVGSVSSAGALVMNGTGTFGTNAVINGGGLSYFNGGNMGIGTTTSSTYRLTVNGGIQSLDYGAAGTANIIIGDDTFLTDVDVANTTALYGVSDNTKGCLRLGSSTGNDICGATGNIGIGTSAPTRKISAINSLGGGSLYSFINYSAGNDSNEGVMLLGIGNTTTTNTRFIKFFKGMSDGSDNYSQSGAAGIGNIHANNTLVVFDTGGTADFGEYMHMGESVEAGDIISQGATDGVKSTPNSNIIGVISRTTGFMGSSDIADQPNTDVVGYVGKVLTKVSTINGPIHNGDAITSSSIPGTGQKATKAGQIVGRALADFDQNSNSNIFSCPEGTPSNVKCGQIILYVNASWYDPDVYITDSGNLNIAGSNGTYTASNQGSLSSRIGIFASAAIAQLKAGMITVSELTASALNVTGTLTTQSLAIASSNMTIAGQSINDFIDARVNSLLDSRLSGLTSPLASSSATVTAGRVIIGHPELDSGSTVLTVNGSASISGTLATNSLTTGTATISGQLSTNELITNNASISGTLHATNIIADNITSLSAQIATLSATTIVNNFNTTIATMSGGTSSSSADFLASLYANGIQTNFMNVASLSATSGFVPTLNSDFVTVNQGLIALGPTSLADTSIAGTLSVNGNLILSDSSINVLGADLQIQPLKQGGVSFEGGQIAFDTDGNIRVNGNAAFAKNVTVGGTLATNYISALPGNDLNINLPEGSNLAVNNASGSAVFKLSQLGDVVASGSGTFKELLANGLNIVRGAQADDSITETTASGSAGTAVINAYQTERTINTPYVTAKSLIYITPTSDTQGVTPYISRQTAEDPQGLLGNGPTHGSFTIEIPQNASQDIKLNWWIVN